jgi:hypothetical protein
MNKNKKHQDGLLTCKVRNNDNNNNNNNNNNNKLVIYMKRDKTTR